MASGAVLVALFLVWLLIRKLQHDSEREHGNPPRTKRPKFD